MAMKKFSTVKEYLDSFPKETKEQLEELRSLIRKVVPKAEEVISYNMPAYKTSRVLVYFAGYVHHIGFYPTSSPIRVFKDELTGYKTSKGAIQFPLGKKIPAGLVKRIVQFRIKEEEERSALAAMKKKRS